MGLLHVLDGNTDENYNVVIHTAVPLGKNSVGVTWKEAGLNSHKTGSTVLTEGTGKGHISSAEKAQVLSGDIIEIVASFPVESGGATQESLDEMINAAINDHLQRTKTQLKYFGYTKT